MNTQRRKFLSQTLTGGLSLFVAQNSSGSDLTNLACQVSASPADALEAYANPLLNLQAELVYESFREVNEALRQCNEVLREIASQVQLLEKEVSKGSKPRVRAEVRRMRELTNLGQAHLKSLNAADSPYVLLAAAAPINIVTMAVEKKTQDLLPPGENKLSLAATGYLNEIVRLVRDSQPLREQLVVLQKEADERVKQIRDDFNAAWRLLLHASHLVDLAKASAAITTTKDAIMILKGLKEFIAKKEAKSKPSTINAIDALIKLLYGITYWIEHPSEVASLTLRSSGSVGFERVSTHQPLTALIDLIEDLQKALENICERNSLKTIATFINDILLPTKGWVLLRRGAAYVPLFGQPLTRNEIINEVERLLKDWGPKVNSKCGRPSTFRALAEAIAPLL